MTNSTIPILDDDAVAEIEARANAAAIWSASEFERDSDADDQQTWEWAWRISGICNFAEEGADEATALFIAHSRADVPALCNTVRVLRDLVYVPKILPDDEEVTYQQEGARLLRAKLKLQSQLEQVTKERDAMRSRCVDAIKNMHANVNGTIRKEDVIEELTSVSIQGQEK